MPNIPQEEISSKFPPELKKFYDSAQKDIHRNPQDKGRKPIRIAQHFQGIEDSYRPSSTLPLAPLVRKIIPNTVIGRPAIPKNSEHQFKLGNFIHEPRYVSTINEVRGSLDEGKLVIKDWREYYNIVKDNAVARQEPEINSFISLVDSIPGACGCSRGALNESAQAMYSQMLPMLEARDSKVFESIKETLKVESLIFREGELILLNV